MVEYKYYMKKILYFLTFAFIYTVIYVALFLMSLYYLFEPVLFDLGESGMADWSFFLGPLIFPVLIIVLVVYFIGLFTIFSFIRTDTEMRKKDFFKNSI